MFRGRFCLLFFGIKFDVLLCNFKEGLYVCICAGDGQTDLRSLFYIAQKDEMVWSGKGHWYFLPLSLLGTMGKSPHSG